MKNWKDSAEKPEMGKFVVLKVWLPENDEPMIVCMKYEGKFIVPEDSTLDWAYIPGTIGYSGDEIKAMQHKHFELGLEQGKQHPCNCKVKAEAPVKKLKAVASKGKQS